MPSRIERRLNRTARADITLAEFPSDLFVAVQLYSVPGNPVYIDSIVFGSEANAADTAATIRTSVGIYRDAILLEPVALAGQVAGKDELLHIIVEDVGLPVPFDEPLILEAGYTYTVVMGVPLLSGAATGAFSLFLTVLGRTVPDNPVEKMPVDVRSGIPDELPAVVIENGKGC
jgi:hypothetical protein